MKVEIEKEEKVFKPFKLTLTVESEDELKYLWHLFGLSLKTVIDESGLSSVSYPANLKGCDQEAFNKIDDKVIELGLKK